MTAPHAIAATLASWTPAADAVMAQASCGSTFGPKWAILNENQAERMTPRHSMTCAQIKQ